MLDKVLENKLRRTGLRRGLVIVKSKRRDPLSLTFGRYWVRRSNEIVRNHPDLQPDPEREFTVDWSQIATALGLKPEPKQAKPKPKRRVRR
jgi:hypothetical protein